MKLARFLVLGLSLFTADAVAARFEIPLRVPLEPLRQALAAQLAASKATPNVIYREGRCRYLNLESPKLEAVDGNLRLTGPGSGALGIELLGNCQNAANWKGTMEFTLAPQIDSAGRLRVRIVDSKLTDDGGSSALGFIWELSNGYVNPRLERFSYALGASRNALASIVRGAAPPQHAAELEAAVKQLQVQPPRVETAVSSCRSRSNCPIHGSPRPQRRSSPRCRQRRSARRDRKSTRLNSSHVSESR